MLGFSNFIAQMVFIVFFTGGSCYYGTPPDIPNEPEPADVGVRVKGYAPSGGCPSGPYGVFLIDEAGVVKWSKKGMSGGLNFIHCGHVPSGEFYLAMLISINQSHPIIFEPQSGDYLGWYKASGDTATLQTIKPPTIYQVYLELVL